MKIDRLRVFMSRDKDRPRVVVAIDTDDGLTGWGECYNHGPDKALPPILDYLFYFIRGQDPRRIEYLVQLLMQQSRFPPGALGLAAISAIDHCLWDISAKALNVPVYRLLGGHVARPGESLCRRLHRAGRRRRRATNSTGSNAEWGLTAFKLSPYRIDMHGIAGARWCAPRPTIFGSLRETVRARLRDRLRRPCQDLRAGAGAASSATRWRPMIRSSSRSRSGPRTSRPGAS